MTRASILLLVLAVSSPGQTTTFTDQTAASGLVVNHQPTYSAGFAAGGAVGDFDRNGFQDVFVPVGGGAPDRLFLNDGNGTFTDQASAWGIAVAHRGTGAVAGDFDGDGWLDLYVTSLGPAGVNAPGQHKLYRNLGGTGFVDVAAAMNVATTSSQAADGWGGAFGDYDLDGDLDLVVAGWLTGANHLFRNDGTTFTDVTVSAGLTALGGIAGFSPRFADMDGDRDPELIFIGDFGTSRYYRNDGNGTFTDLTASSNTAMDGTEMGNTVGDFDEDGLFDFYVTTISTNNLYLNQGNHTYQNLAASSGVENTGWGWGTVAIDFNHDTLLDIVAATQSGRQYAFRNVSSPPSQHAFQEVALQIGIGTTVSGRGLANIDYDNDGDQDLVIFPQSGPIKLYRNDLAPASNTHWLRVVLDTSGDPTVAPDGVGALVKVKFGPRELIRAIDAGSNYLSNSELSAHFGLGSVTIVDDITVTWPDGVQQVLPLVPVDQTVVVSRSVNPNDAFLFSITPSSVPEDSPALALALQGQGFAPTSVVRLDGAPIASAFVSPTQMTATVPASALAHSGTRAVLVDNAAIAGAPSQTRTLTVVGPSLGAAGGGLQIVTVNGQSGGTARRVDVPPGGLFTIQVAQPVANPNPANFALFGTIGVPPASFSFAIPGVLGNMAFYPCPLAPNFPGLFTVANSFGPTPCPVLVPAGPTPFSASAFAPPFPLQLTLQGLVHLQPTPTGAPIFIFTNGVLIDID